MWNKFGWISKSDIAKIAKFASSSNNNKNWIQFWEIQIVHIEMNKGAQPKYWTN